MNLAADAEFRDQLRITSFTFAPGIIQEFPARGDHGEEAAARMVVFFVGLEVVGQIVDPLGEDRNLYFRRARIAFFNGEFLDELLLSFSSNRHRQSLLFKHPTGMRVSLIA